MKLSPLARVLATGTVALAAAATLSACAQDKVASGTVHVRVADAAETVESSGHTVTGTGKPITVKANAATVTVACSSAEDITIMGADATVELTGDCGDVAVTGANQTITTGALKKLKVLGASNTITTGDVQSMRLTGADNTVTYTSSAEEPAVLGAENTITKK